MNPTYRPRDYISYSTLMSFIRCPRKYFYEKCGVSSRDEPTALIYGTAMHRAVPMTFTDGGLEAAIHAFDLEWNEDLANRNHSRERAIAQLSHFAHTHSRERSLYQLVDPPPAPEGLKVSGDRSPFEIYFALDIGLRIPLVGWVDAWCRHRDSGKLYAWELKTASRLSSSMFDSAEFLPQLLVYTLVCSTLATEPVAGAMFEVILKDAHKVDNMCAPVPVQPHMLEDTAQWLRYWGSMLLECEDRLLLQHDLTKLPVDTPGSPPDPAIYFPKNFSGCTAYPMFYQTGSACEFMTLCRPQDWKSLLPYYDIKPEHKMIELTRGAT